MDAPLPLVLELLEWIRSRPRSLVWEDAVDRGHIAHDGRAGRLNRIVPTAAGADFLRLHRNAR